jgi:hypothetical protein
VPRATSPEIPMNGLFARARSLWRGLRRPDRLAAEMDE